MFLPTNEKQFGFWKMRRSGMQNISIANELGITRQGVSQALRAIDEKIDASLREMAQANRIQIEKIDVEKGVSVWQIYPIPDRCVHLRLGEAWHAGLVRA